MARPDKGILGGFNGKVGTVVGSNWKGISYMRSLPKKKKNRKFTKAQQIQHAKFALATNFIRDFNTLFDTSFQNSFNQTSKNAALSNLITQAIGGVYPNLAINYSSVSVARGSLKTADNPAAESTVAGKIRFSWPNNSGMGNAKTDDKSILVAYNPLTGDAIFTTAGATRETGEAELNVAYFSGKEVQTWMSFISADGYITADSSYTGAVLVV